MFFTNPVSGTAALHGYDYKLVHTDAPNDRNPRWTKVAKIRKNIEHYDFVVFMDADTVFKYPAVPLEFLFNRWGITPRTLVAAADDPDRAENDDKRGGINQNAGFFIAQRSPRTRQLLDAWFSCAWDHKQKGCSKYKYNFPHEQGAFSTYTRHLFNDTEDVKRLPCAEANGSPRTKAKYGCGGELVEHYWKAQDAVPAAFQSSIMQYVLLQMHQRFNDNREALVEDQRTPHSDDDDDDDDDEDDDNTSGKSGTSGKGKRDDGKDDLPEEDEEDDDLEESDDLEEGNMVPV
ncbi:hypothetical protein NUU61_002256 [Penicillium alfredii]|uniref:Nucleotide-diphospho-sugar transferase domain-containing protein n=1 Tax=Penicillium alfredii TaxID=1506179 RepID=A0A9W9KFT4_9EURO|nr:uncharacterized protein NUU61_002256 [Penicillium alfredii]KAJ5104909.1 hypothetical protein NUU61_002256 [Penicillium alfredii]